MAVRSTISQIEPCCNVLLVTSGISARLLQFRIENRRLVRSSAITQHNIDNHGYIDNSNHGHIDNSKKAELQVRLPGGGP